MTTLLAEQIRRQQTHKSGSLTRQTMQNSKKKESRRFDAMTALNVTECKTHRKMTSESTCQILFSYRAQGSQNYLRFDKSLTGVPDSKKNLRFHTHVSSRLQPTKCKTQKKDLRNDRPKPLLHPHQFPSLHITMVPTF